MEELQPMVVCMYTRTREYGFCASPSGEQVYFHADVFHRLQPQGPPPIIGERVLVAVVEGKKRPKAQIVRRQDLSERKRGEVTSFDPGKGWGFLDSEGTGYFLHRSEMEGSWLPVRGTRVSFYAGDKEGQARACHVRMET